MQNNHQNKTKTYSSREILGEHQISIGELRKLIRSRIRKISREQKENHENALPPDKFINSLTKLGEFFMKILKLEQSFYGINITTNEISSFQQNNMPQEEIINTELNRDDLNLMRDFSESALENYEKLQEQSQGELLNINPRHSYLFH